MYPIIQTSQTEITAGLLRAALASGRRTMITAVVVTAITAMAAGWVLALITASAAMSHSQQRMQHKVRYWQAEAALARAQAQAERRARQALTQQDAPPGANH